MFFGICIETLCVFLYLYRDVVCVFCICIETESRFHNGTSVIPGTLNVNEEGNAQNCQTFCAHKKC